MTSRPRPRLLDLFCCAGGAALGYHQAGFDVVGVDHRSQPRYPFRFVHADAIGYLLRHGVDFDAIHASPPCQAHSTMTKLGDWKQAQKGQLALIDYDRPRLIEPVRDALRATGKPYIIENVPGAPLFDAVTICGTSFGLGVIRHRLFETNWTFVPPPHGSHKELVQSGRYCCVVGEGGAWRLNCGSRDTNDWRKAMGIDWMSRKELTQAIPPAFTEFIGRQLLRSWAEA